MVSEVVKRHGMEYLKGAVLREFFPSSAKDPVGFHVFTERPVSAAESEVSTFPVFSRKASLDGFLVVRYRRSLFPDYIKAPRCLVSDFRIIRMFFRQFHEQRIRFF